MNIPGAIDAELKAAREEGRLDDIKWAIYQLRAVATHLGTEASECMKAGDGPSDRATRLYTEAGALLALADWLAEKIQTSESHCGECMNARSERITPCYEREAE